MSDESFNQVTLTDGQLDDILKKWKKKGAYRVFGYVFIGSLPLALAGGLFFSDLPSLTILEICAVYYCGLAFLAAETT